MEGEIIHNSEERILDLLSKRYYHSPSKAMELSDRERYRILFGEEVKRIFIERPDLLERFRFPNHEEEVLSEVEILLSNPPDIEHHQG